jgi:hypothetical protein
VTAWTNDEPTIAPTGCNDWTEWLTNIYELESSESSLLERRTLGYDNTFVYIVSVIINVMPAECLFICYVNSHRSISLPQHPFLANLISPYYRSFFPLSLLIFTANEFKEMSAETASTGEQRKCQQLMQVTTLFRRFLWDQVPCESRRTVIQGLLWIQTIWKCEICEYVIQ